MSQIFQVIFCREKYCILIQISLYFVSKDPTDDDSTFIQVIARCWLGDELPPEPMMNYSKTFNISCTLSGNKIVDNSDVVGASSVGAAPTTSSFST